MMEPGAHSSPRDRFLIYGLAPRALFMLSISLGGILLLYCLYYIGRGDWMVATGGLAAAVSLFAFAGPLYRIGRHPGASAILAALGGINIGAVISITALGVPGIIWFAPLVFVNLLFAGIAVGSTFTVVTVSLIVWLGGLYSDMDLAVNIVGALVLSFLIALAFSASLRERMGRLVTEARIDPLTGAWNRRSLDQALADRLSGLDESGALSLILLDIDGFKTLNDEHGHTAGDTVLQQFVRCLRANLRKDDQIYRFGGEEFVVLLDIDGNAALKLAENVRRAVATHRFLDDIAVTVSAGVVEARPGEAEAQLVRRADVALYRAKREGRNCCRIADAD